MKEVFAILIAVLMYPFACFSSNAQIVQSGQKEKPILIFVHGYLHNKTVALPFIRYFKKKEYSHFYTLNLGSPHHSIGVYQKRLALFVEQIRQENPNRPIVLVGHSMGGLVSTEYALSEVGEGKIAKVVTVGTPHQGTSLILAHMMKHLCSCVDEMIEGSPFVIEHQRKMEQNRALPILCIGSPSDEIVIPQQNAFPNYEGDFPQQAMQCGQVTIVPIKDEGHLSLIFSEKVHKAIDAFLNLDSKEIQPLPEADQAKR